MSVLDMSSSRLTQSQKQGSNAESKSGVKAKKEEMPTSAHDIHFKANLKKEQKDFAHAFFSKRENVTIC